jgi:L-ascorbate metabolism protein UlaG (beta-lactamase superfamily)
VDGVEFTATPSRHFSGRSLIQADADQTLWAGWALHGPKHRVYYSGDTAMFPQFEEIGARLGPFDVTLIEVGAYNQLWADVHLGPEQALRAHQMVRGELLIPVHWGTFDLALHAWTEPMERLLVGAAETGVRLSSPRPGESIEPASASVATRWWPEIPWQTKEQAPVVSSRL